MTNEPILRPRVAAWPLWAIGIVALLWNGLGTFLWAGTTFAPEMAVADLPAEQRAYVLSLPAWSTVTWGLGVFGGLAGAILLLLRKRPATPAFGISLLGAITNQLVYVTNPPPPGFVNLPLIACIVGMALLQFWYANRAKRQGLL